MTFLTFLQNLQNAITQVLTADVGFLVNWATPIYSAFAAMILAAAIVRASLGQEHTIKSLVADLYPVFGVILAFWMVLLYWNSPLPVVGVPVPALVTGTTENLAQGIGENNLQTLLRRCEETESSLENPSWADGVTALLSYSWMVGLLVFFQALAFAVIVFGLAVEALAILMGPIFIPFAIVPKFDWLFWGWLKFFIQYSLYRVVAAAVLTIVVNVLVPSLDALPKQMGIGQEILLLPLFVVMFFVCMALVGSVPILTHHMCSGLSGGRGTLPRIVVAAVRG